MSSVSAHSPSLAWQCQIGTVLLWRHVFAQKGISQSEQIAPGVVFCFAQKGMFYFTGPGLVSVFQIGAFIQYSVHTLVDFI